jgi:membrane-bound acyltransferase YfiQ involved in biofilm formation
VTTLGTTISNHALATDQRSDAWVQSAPAVDAKFLRHVHYFRAFAIVSILFAHLWELPTGHEDRPILYSLRYLLFHASTIYFLFISGFLFIHLSGKFDTKRYYMNKARYVVAPYALLSTLIFCVKHGQRLGTESTSELLKQLGLTLLSGTAVGPYWYIPFAVITFLLSPLLLALPPRALRWLCLLACPLPLLGTRTSSIGLPLFVYFFPVYLLGCLAAMNYSAFTRFVRNSRWLLILAVVISSSLLVARGTIPHSDGLRLTESLFYIQKISICFLVLVALQRWDSHEAKLWSSIATYSFALYFTHPVIACVELRLKILSSLPDVEWLVMASSVALVPGFLGVNLLLCAGIKRLLGRRSRYLIGV